jgi:hypothetical protein
MALEALAHHLEVSGQHKRLLQLFADQRWINLRRDAGDLSYEGVLADIRSAERGLTQSAEPPASCFAAGSRLALIRASIVSLSVLPVALLVRAVAVGVWAVPRALAATSRYEQLELRALAYAGLLRIPELSAADREDVWAAVEEFVVETGGPVAPWILTELIAQLPEDRAEPMWSVLTRQLSPQHFAASTIVAEMWPPIGVGNRMLDSLDVERMLGLLPQRHHRVVVAAACEAVLDALTNRTPPVEAPSGAADVLGHELPDLLAREPMTAKFFDDTHARLVEIRLADPPRLMMRALLPYLSAHPDPNRFCDALLRALPASADKDTCEVFASACEAMGRPDVADDMRRGVAPVSAEPVDVAVVVLRLLTYAQTFVRDEWRTGVWERIVASAEGTIPSAPESPTVFDIVERLRQITEVMLSPGDGPDSRLRRKGLLELVRSVGPLLMVPAMGYDKSTDTIKHLVAELFDPEFGEKQLQSLSQATGDFPAPVVDAYKRVRGEFLRCMLDVALEVQMNLGHAWNGDAQRVAGEADLSWLVEHVGALPAEPRRSQPYAHLIGDEDAAGGPVQVQAIGLAARHVPADSVEALIDVATALGQPVLRARALDLIAFRLDGQAASRGIEHATAKAEPDAQFVALTALTPRGAGAERDAVLFWRDQIAETIPNPALQGSAFREAMRDADAPERAALEERWLHALKSFGPNHQLDTLVAMLSPRERPMSVDEAEAIIGLPAVSLDRWYSWRASALLLFADDLPDASIDRALDAALELPWRLSVGDAENDGFHWTFEYVQAGVLEALASRVADSRLGELFEAAIELPWTPRRALLSAIAPRADEDLARRILDLTLARTRMYDGIPDEIPRPFVLEGIHVSDPPADFRVRREVDCAEIIAVLGPRLSASDVSRAVRRARTFTNEGPQAWLPGQLADLLSDGARAEVIPPALVSAIAFAGILPERLDLVTMLLPHAQRLRDDVVEPIRAIVQQYFPGKEKLWLSQEEHQQLPPGDREVYAAVMNNRPGARMIRENNRDDLTEDDQRRLMEEMIVDPVFHEGVLETLVVRLVEHAPLHSRVAGMAALAEFLPAEQFAELVKTTIDRLLAVAGQHPEVVVLLTTVVRFATDDDRLRIAEALPSAWVSASPDLAALADSLFPYVLQDIGSRAHEFLPLDAGRRAPMDRAFSNERFLAAMRKLNSDRGRLVEELVEHLDARHRERLVDAALTLEDHERGNALEALLPGIAGEARTRVVDALFTLPAGLIRLMVLWTCRDHFTPQERQASVGPAVAAAEALEDPAHATAALLLVSGNADGAERAEIYRKCLERIPRIASRMRMLEALRGLASLNHRSPKTLDEAIETVLDLPDVETRAVGLAVVLDVRDAPKAEYAEKRNLALTTGLAAVQVAAERGRRECLETLGGLGPIAALLGDDDLYGVARSVYEICNAWAWA